MDYQFYIKMDEQEFGPDSLNEIKELPLLDDTLVTESRLNGEWRPACEFDFQALSESLRDSITTTKSKKTVYQYQDSRKGQNPPILKLWNWGAFSLSWIWGVCNGIYWPLIIIAFNFVPYVGPFVWLAISIYLGIYGNTIAWNIEKKLYSDHRNFTSIQAKWNLAGVIVFIVVLILLIGKLYVSLCNI